MIFYRALSVGFCFVVLLCVVVVVLLGKQTNFGAPVPYGYYVGTWYISYSSLLLSARSGG